MQFWPDLSQQPSDHMHKKGLNKTKKSHMTKIWKTTFPKEFFNKIWLKVEEHEYIYIFEKNKIFCLKMAAKTSFVILCNNAHLC